MRPLASTRLFAAQRSIRFSSAFGFRTNSLLSPPPSTPTRCLFLPFCRDRLLDRAHCRFACRGPRRRPWPGQCADHRCIGMLALEMNVGSRYSMPETMMSLVVVVEAASLTVSHAAGFWLHQRVPDAHAGDRHHGADDPDAVFRADHAAPGRQAFAKRGDQHPVTPGRRRGCQGGVKPDNRGP